MIVGAALLVLLGLALFVAGILTGVTALYWACVAVCVVAAVLLLLVRRKLRATPGAPARTAAKAPSTPAVPAVPDAGQAAPVAIPPAAWPAVGPEDLADPPVEQV